MAIHDNSMRVTVRTGTAELVTYTDENESAVIETCDSAGGTILIEIAPAASSSGSDASDAADDDCDMVHRVFDAEGRLIMESRPNAEYETKCYSYDDSDELLSD